MFEFKDDFLMGKQEEAFDAFLCSVSNSLEKQLAELAAIVGDEDADTKTSDEGTAIDHEGVVAAETPPNDMAAEPGEVASSFSNEGDTNITDVEPTPVFDIEKELQAAFEANGLSDSGEGLNAENNVPASPVESAVPLEATDPVSAVTDALDEDLASRVAHAPTINVQEALSSLSGSATPAEPVAETQFSEMVSGDIETAISTGEAQEAAIPSMEFNDLIADELDKALAEEVAADPELTSQPDAGAVLPESVEQPVFEAEMESEVLGQPADDSAPAADNQEFEMELSRLMGVAEDAPAAQPAPPAPVETQTPAQRPEIVEAPAIPVVEEQPIYTTTLASDDWQPPQMSDYSSSAGLQGEPVTEPGQAVPPANVDQISAIDAVLGATAAVGAAATADAVSKNRGLPDAEEYAFDPASEPMFQEPAAAAVTPQYGEPDNGVVAAQQHEHDMDEYGLQEELSIPEPIVHVGNNRGAGRKAAFAVLGIALLGGTAALAWNYVGDSSGPAKTILASTEVVKEKPADAGGEVVPNQDQAVYRSVDGKAAKEPEQKELADKTEAPIKVASKAAPKPLVAELTKPDATTAAATKKSESRVVDTEDASAVVPKAPVKARSVRTVVVKPDGTIISTSADQTSKTQEVAALKPSYTPPTTETQAAKVKTVKVAAVNTGDQAQPLVKPVEPVLVQPTKPAATTVAAPAKPAKIEAKAPAAVEAPAPKPVEAAKPIAKAKEQKVAAVQKAPAKKVAIKKVTPKKVVKPAPATATPSVSSAYAVQISSQRSVDAAKKSYSTLARRYAGVLKGKGVDIRRTEIAGRGTFYRVRIPANSKKVAQRICSQLKKRGGDCLVTR